MARRVLLRRPARPTNSTTTAWYASLAVAFALLPVLGAVLAPAVVGATTAQPMAPAGAAVEAPAPADQQQDTAAGALARELRIPIGEASRRVVRQDQMGTFAEALRTRLGERFGGAWIDQTHAGRLTVAVLDAPSETAARTAATAAGLPDTAVVRVHRSAASLERVAGRLGVAVAAANSGAPAGLETDVAADQNAVELRVPGTDKLTAAQRGLVDSVRAKRTWGDGVVAVDGATTRVPHRPLACASQTTCDPPLRGGVVIRTTGARCTSAFTARSGSRSYLLTAGHCLRLGTTWSAGTASSGTVPIGSNVRAVFGSGGDMGLVSVDNPGFWRPAARVFPENAIRSTGTALVGASICSSGASGVSCGQVTRTDATISYPEQTVQGLSVTTACSRPGDSGAAILSGTTAYGILSGGPSTGCGTVFQPIRKAAATLGVTVLTS